MRILVRWLVGRRRRAECPEAEAALARARSALEEARARRPEVTEIAGRLRQLRHENHLAARMRAALYEGR
ncbi:hypothetical protein [Streptomyces sp. ST2-7A]|uniref:DUF7620 family protein n=1 Tax=Streptomyces sp. ST2-7A TaxID=2907214 RepID=UPI001F36AA83|nr:hypothetical protein [Streptomyces sp. ST2-7A]MCE7081142.1 hypothetical protein [Streptomyces sp. ST2-7A]